MSGGKSAHSFYPAPGIYHLHSKRAFQLLKYALEYEGTVCIPDKFPERNIMTAMTTDELDEMLNGKW